MAAPDITSTALATGSSIGRSFNVTSLVPSLFLVMLTWTVIESGAVTGPPDMQELGSALGSLSLGAVGIVLLISFAIAYVLHPAQYALTQLLEGYWGTGRVGRALMVRGIKRNRIRQQTLEDELHDAKKLLKQVGHMVKMFPREDPTDPAVVLLVAQQQIAKALAGFPEDSTRVMPTRLGNVLRRHEDLAGQAYGLPGVDVVPPLALVAKPEHNVYLNEAAEQLDAAVSVCVVMGVATGIVTATTLTDGWWLLLALAPYAVGVLAYQGAVSVAHSYGTAMRRLVDLDRFALYEALHLPMPFDDEAERKLAAVVNKQLQGKVVAVRFRHSALKNI